MHRKVATKTREITSVHWFAGTKIPIAIKSRLMTAVRTSATMYW